MKNKGTAHLCKFCPTCSCRVWDPNFWSMSREGLFITYWYQFIQAFNWSYGHCLFHVFSLFSKSILILAIQIFIHSDIQSFLLHAIQIFIHSNIHTLPFYNYSNIHSFKYSILPLSDYSNIHSFKYSSPTDLKALQFNCRRANIPQLFLFILRN